MLQPDKKRKERRRDSVRNRGCIWSAWHKYLKEEKMRHNSRLIFAFRIESRINHPGKRGNKINKPAMQAKSTTAFRDRGKTLLVSETNI